MESDLSSLSGQLITYSQGLADSYLSTLANLRMDIYTASKGHAGRT